jgi:hypothetical protein
MVPRMRPDARRLMRPWWFSAVATLLIAATGDVFAAVGFGAVFFGVGGGVLVLRVRLGTEA